MEIPLRKRGGEITAFAVVDPENHAQLNKHRWHLYRGYAARTLRNGSKVLMHREIMGAVPRDGLEIHHADGDRLNNRQANLVVVVTTRAEHPHFHAGHGASGLRGVRPASSGSRWTGNVKHNGVRIHLGTFDTPKQASEVVEAWWTAHKARERQRPAKIPQAA